MRYFKISLLSKLMLFTFIFCVLTPGALFPQEDTTPPNLIEFDYTPKIVNVGQGSQYVYLTFRVTDDLVGLRVASCAFKSPSGTKFMGTDVYDPSHRISGDSLDGVYYNRMFIPVGSEAGTWSISHINLYDKIHNIRRYTEGDLIAMGFPTKLYIEGGADLVPPILRNFSFSTQYIDVSLGDATLNITMQVTDEYSGFYRGGYTFRSPSGQQTQTIVFFTPTDRISGDKYDGVYEKNLPIPRFSEDGTWHLVYIYLADNADNVSRYYTADLVALGFPTELEVVSDPSDVTPPDLHEFDFSPSKISVVSGPQDVPFTFKLTDDFSGFIRGSCVLQSPSGQQGQSLHFFDPEHLISGDNRDGIYESMLTIPQFSELGVWHIIQISLLDKVGNVHLFLEEELEAMEFPTELEVYDNENPAADAGEDQTIILGESASLDGSESSDSDGYVVSYEWEFGDGSPVETGPLVLHYYSETGTFSAVLTVADDKGAVSSDKTSITVISATQAAAVLVGLVNDLGLNSGLENSLNTKLTGSVDSIAKGKNNAAINKLNAFINQVNAQRGKKISAQDADRLIDLAKRIISSIQNIM
ncbi:PKD domain-containing protein [Acidobacteriota bacterium]